MGQSTVIIVVGAILFGAVLAFNMQRDTIDADDALAEHQVKVLARNIATTGLNAAVYRLADSYQMGSWINESFSGDYNGGSYSVQITAHDPVNNNSGTAASGDTVDVVARGRFGDGRRVIYARYKRAKSTAGIPPEFRNVITTDLYTQLDGNVLVSAINKNLNASIHTNDDLDVRGMSFLVEGYGTYTGELNITGNREPEDLDGNFMPNINYNGDDPNVFWADSVHIQTIDAQQLQQRAAFSGAYFDESLVVNGGVVDFTDPTNPLWENAQYSCTGQCGTSDNPFVLYVDGSIDFIDRVSIVGHGIIFSTEDVVITPEGSGGGVFGGLNENKETVVMVASGQDVEINGNACLGLGPNRYMANNGREYNNNQCTSDSGEFDAGITLHAEGKVEFGGTPFLVGGIVAPETHFRGGGNPWITYAAPTEEVVDIGFDNLTPIGPIMIAYSEWSHDVVQ